MESWVVEMRVNIIRFGYSVDANLIDIGFVDVF